MRKFLWLLYWKLFFLGHPIIYCRIVQLNHKPIQCISAIIPTPAIYHCWKMLTIQHPDTNRCKIGCWGYNWIWSWDLLIFSKSFKLTRNRYYTSLNKQRVLLNLKFKFVLPQICIPPFCKRNTTLTIAEWKQSCWGLCYFTEFFLQFIIIFSNWNKV